MTEQYGERSLRRVTYLASSDLLSYISTKNQDKGDELKLWEQELLDVKSYLGTIGIATGMLWELLSWDSLETFWPQIGLGFQQDQVKMEFLDLMTPLLQPWPISICIGGRGRHWQGVTWAQGKNWLKFSFNSHVLEFLLFVESGCCSRKNTGFEVTKNQVQISTLLF